MTTERVPPDTSTDEMEFYWDSSHFKERVGDWILDRLFEVDRPTDRAPPDFGVLLTAENIDHEFERVRVSQQSYRHDHPKDTEFVKSLMRQVKVEPVKYVNAE